MKPARGEVVRQALRTPRAAAAAGVIFSILYTTSVVSIQLALQGEGEAALASLSQTANLRQVGIALTLMPFAGIAFLWFVGVVRDRIGPLEDQFFSTVFFGSGLLFIAMSFAAAAIAGGLVASLVADAEGMLESGIAGFGRAITFNITHVYAVRMAGVFMISLATVWLRTDSLPRWAVLITYALAVLLLLGSSQSLWPMLVFPGWVLAISLEHLARSHRRFESRGAARSD